MHATAKAGDLLDVVPFCDLQCPIKMSKQGKANGKDKYRLRNDEATRLQAANMAKRFAGTSPSSQTF